MFTLFPVLLIPLAVIFKKYISFKSPVIRFFIIIFSGLTVEAFSWLNNFVDKVNFPALFNPSLIPDLIQGFGFYTGIAFGWSLAVSKFSYSLAEIFLLSAFFGILVEQNGLIFLSFNFFSWIYVGLVYIPITLPAFIIIPPKHNKSHFVKYLFVLISTIIFSFLGLAVIKLLY